MSLAEWVGLIVLIVFACAPAEVIAFDGFLLFMQKLGAKWCKALSSRVQWRWLIILLIFIASVNWRTISLTFWDQRAAWKADKTKPYPAWGIVLIVLTALGSPLGATGLAFHFYF